MCKVPSVDDHYINFVMFIMFYFLFTFKSQHSLSTRGCVCIVFIRYDCGEKIKLEQCNSSSSRAAENRDLVTNIEKWRGFALKSEVN